MAEWSLPEEAWLQPGPEPALRGNDRNVKKVPDISADIHMIFNSNLPFALCPLPLLPCFCVTLFEQVQTGLLSLCLPMLLLSHVSLDPVSIHHHQLTQKHTHTEWGGTFIHPVIVLPHTAMTLPVCLGLHTRGNTPPQHNVPPAFLFAVPPTSTHPLSYQTWPAARLASVNPSVASQTKGSSNQICVGLGLL